jgi:hypothetical protein
LLQNSETDLERALVAALGKDIVDKLSPANPLCCEVGEANQQFVSILALNSFPMQGYRLDCNFLTLESPMLQWIVGIPASHKFPAQSLLYDAIDDQSMQHFNFILQKD